MTNHEQCKEEIIELLTTISEVIWSGGLLLLDMMHRGYLDELLTEDDEEYNKKVEIPKLNLQNQSSHLPQYPSSEYLLRQSVYLSFSFK